MSKMSNKTPMPHPPWQADAFLKPRGIAIPPAWQTALFEQVRVGHLTPREGAVLLDLLSLRHRQGHRHGSLAWGI